LEKVEKKLEMIPPGAFRAKERRVTLCRRRPVLHVENNEAFRSNISGVRTVEVAGYSR